MKIMTIVGARPQFIKASVISRQIKAFNQNNSTQIDEVIVHTGQHFDDNMSSLFFEQLSIPAPHMNLGIHSASHSQMTAKMMLGIEQALMEYSPDFMLLYGDTNSTLAGALVAAQSSVKVAHVEAGLRSFNRSMPEETNRVLTDHVSDLLFCPTQTAVKHLNNEGITQGVRYVGDVMLDAFNFAKAGLQPSLPEACKQLHNEAFVLATIHRQSNTNDLSRLKSILDGLRRVSVHTKVIIPLHPRTRKILEQNNLMSVLSDLLVVEPLGYQQMVWLLDKAQMVVTDSGGLQKEAYFAQTPCVTVREETEWTETLEDNANCLVGADENQIYSACMETRSCRFGIHYGNGTAGQKIVTDLFNYHCALK